MAVQIFIWTYCIPEALYYSCLDNYIVTSLHINKHNLIEPYWLINDNFSLFLHKISTEAEGYHAVLASDSLKDVEKVT